MKIALITGGSNGIGKATAFELAKRGTHVLFTYYSNSSGAEQIVRDIEQKHQVRAMALKLDLGQSSSFEEFVRQVRVRLHEVWNRSTFDYLVNNGGVGSGMPFAEISEEYFDKIFDVNFKGPFFLTQRLVGLMEEGGKIVNTSSTSSRGAFLGYSAYGPSKAALSSWTRYLAKELAPRKISVNAVSPGPVHTNFSDGAFDKHPEFIAMLGEQAAFGRIGQPEDIAKVILHFLSDDFGWVTAQDIDVSGGHLL